MFGRQLHIPIWPKRFRGGRYYWHHENYIDRIVSRKDAEKLRRHYNRRSATVTHEQV